MARNLPEQKRLFELGVTAGRSFLSALKAGKISEKEFNDNVPVGAIWVLRGPSTDFIIGRVYENAVEDAYNSIHRKDGKELRISDATEEILAKNKFTSKNCALIR